MDTATVENRKFPFAPLILQILCLIVYSAVMIDPSSSLLRSLHPPLFALIVGFGFYMTYRGGHSRLAGIVGLMFLLPLAMSLIEVGMMKHQSFARSGSVFSLLAESMLHPRRYVISILVVAAAIAASKWWKSGASFRSSAILTAVAVLIANFLFIWAGRFFSAPSHVLFAVILRIVVEALAMPPFALLARALAEKGGERFSPSAGARLWCALVFLATALVLVMNVCNKQPGVVQSLLLLPATVGAFLLLFGMRSGWYLYLIGFELMAVQTLVMVPMAGEQRPLLFASLGGAVVNLAITWGLIKSRIGTGSSREGIPEEQ